MNKKKMLLILDELLELPQGTLFGNELLSNLKWDSLSVIGFIAICDENFELAVSPRELCKCETVNDLIALLGEKVTEEAVTC